MSLHIRLYTIIEMRILEFILRCFYFFNEEISFFTNQTHSAECSATAINLVLIAYVPTANLHVGESILIAS